MRYNRKLKPCGNMTVGEIIAILVGIAALAVAIYGVRDSRQKINNLRSLVGTLLRTSQLGKDVKGYPPGFDEKDFPTNFLASPAPETMKIEENLSGDGQERVNGGEKVNAVLNSDDPERKKDITG